MIRSMTGFGAGERDTDQGTVRVEVRSVNSRGLNIQVRGGSAADALERNVRETVRGALSRGQVTVTVSLQGAGGQDAPLPELDMVRAHRYVHLMHRLRDELGLEGPIDLASIVRFGDVFRGRPEEEGLPGEAVDVALGTALEALDEMRMAEGARLEADLNERCREIGSALDVIRARAPERLTEERDRLREAVRELTEGVEVDEDRLAREIAYLAERWDVNEEIVRLGAHLEAFAGTLEGADGGPVGKRLAFLAQEMHREANTIGAKANDAALQHVVVTVKEEIDRLKEQLENVE